MTVSVAALVVVDPNAFVNFASYFVPLCAVVVGLSAVLGRGLSAVLPWLAFSLLTGASTPALQAVSRLHRTRTEQALLVLLPGVPRGAPVPAA